jgi:3-hydroxyisobutyrate dehydrogenase-like beta-hydroxyacid dehydrogenase
VILRVDARSAVPPYEQIRAQVATMAAAGVLPVGTRLPPIRQLAKDLGLAVGLAEARGLELRLAQAARSRLQAADRDGLGELDFSAVVAHLRGTGAAGG